MQPDFREQHNVCNLFRVGYVPGEKMQWAFSTCQDCGLTDS
jgi:hypothetical protein